MLVLIIYELRSHWNSIFILSSVLLLWDILLFFSFDQLSLLLHTLFYLTWIGFSVIYILIHAFMFYTDFLNRNAFFINLTPNKIWKIILSKLIPIWSVYFVLGIVHSVFMFFANVSNTLTKNAETSFSMYCVQLFTFHFFMFLLMTLSLLFLWVGILQIRLLVQKIRNTTWLVLLVLAGGGCLLLLTLRNLLVTGLSTQHILSSAFITFPYMIMLTLFLLSALLFWVVWILWRQYTDL